MTKRKAHRNRAKGQNQNTQHQDPPEHSAVPPPTTIHLLNAPKTSHRATGKQNTHQKGPPEYSAVPLPSTSHLASAVKTGKHATSRQSTHQKALPACCADAENGGMCDICWYEAVFGEKPRALLQYAQQKKKLAREWLDRRKGKEPRGKEMGKGKEPAVGQDKGKGKEKETGQNKGNTEGKLPKLSAEQRQRLITAIEQDQGAAFDATLAQERAQGDDTNLEDVTRELAEGLVEILGKEGPYDGQVLYADDRMMVKVRREAPGPNGE